MGSIISGSFHMEGKMTVVFNNEPNKEIDCNVAILQNGEYTISKDKKHTTIFSAQTFLWNTHFTTFSSSDPRSPITIFSK
ncbi:hypothetical protein [Shimazuella alba]|uniref:Uncharacterized protein n=1 Tax=Shimazuella alba TaxID=2690964 RepID=A0A6I4VSA0_9BACL|nr:hypothetical protein [Shimazuella alba]MXQ54609.1 hypothetical protein [Shimazuella alba]